MHPLRDATGGALKCHPHLAISIHASLAGCNLACRIVQTEDCLFQFMHPLRDATTIPHHASLISKIFQFMHPLRDATLGSLSRSASQKDFNSYIPFGMQLFAKVDCLFRFTHFNSCTPCGMQLINLIFLIFSIPASLAGCNGQGMLSVTSIEVFQFMHSIRNATRFDLVKIRYVHFISIHASFIGCNIRTSYTMHGFPSFQFMHPLRDAT